jgi:hypothetical protein
LLTGLGTSPPRWQQKGRYWAADDGCEAMLGALIVPSGLTAAGALLALGAVTAGCSLDGAGVTGAVGAVGGATGISVGAPTLSAGS